MKGHLIQFTSNGVAPITETNVLLEIHAWASRVSVFGELRRNLYLRKSLRISQSKPKTISIDLITFHYLSLGSNESFEVISIQFGH